LVWGLFACSFNVLYGYTGLLSFGQSLFFGVGGLRGGAGVRPSASACPAGHRLGVTAAVAVALTTGWWIVQLPGHAFSLATLVMSLIFYYLC